MPASSPPPPPPALIALTAITGVLYPVGMTLVARALFPRQANGSLLRDPHGEVRGSLLIGQPFTGPRWFHSRPSATGETPYDPTASGGSNLGPTNPALATLVADRAAAVSKDNATHTGTIPIDLVTASGSGLDPHISPAAALLQVPRVAAARGLAEQTLQGLLDRHVEPAVFGILGCPRVNVLQLNLALESLSGVNAPGPSRASAPPPP